MATQRSAIGIQGLKDVRRTMRATTPMANRVINQELRKAVVPIAAEARVLAPKRSGKMAASTRPYATGSKVGVRSFHPGAGVVHWGGTISPRGFPITFSRTEFITRAVRGREAAIAKDISDSLQAAARRVGWIATGHRDTAAVARLTTSRRRRSV
jgi:hypothetical protein